MTSATTNTQDLAAVFTEEFSRSILDFWFAGVDVHPSQEQAMRWFRSDTEFDEECRSKFSTVLSKFSTSTPSAILPLATSPTRALSLLILLDQIPRNIFRGDLSASVYTTTDPLAVAVSLHSLSPPLRYDLGPENTWKTVPSKRMWFYLPLVHSEQAELHKRGCEEIAKEVLDDCNEEKERVGESAGLFMAGMLKGQFEEHRAVVERFGRYPYRNKVLGRDSTEEEKEWMENSGVAWAR